MWNRIWAMPNKNTFRIKPIRDLLQRYCTSGTWLDPFANNSLCRTVCPNATWITNDLNPHCTADFHLDALDFLNAQIACAGVVYDPPYSTRQISECYQRVGLPVTKETTQSSYWSKQKDVIAQKVGLNGIVICFGWNSGGLGINRGFELIEGLLVPHGGAHNDTIVTVERKVRDYGGKAISGSTRRPTKGNRRSVTVIGAKPKNT